MSVSENEVVKLAPIVGVNNTAKEHSVPDGYVRAAENVDVDASGKVSRRKGYQKLADLIGARSLYAVEDESFAVIAVGAQLGVLKDSSITFVAACHPFNDVSSAQVLDDVVCSDGEQWVRVTDNGATAFWTEQPDRQPAVAVGSGSLTPGAYLVAATFVDENGRESGCAGAVEVTVPDGGSLQLTGVPIAADANTKTNIYVSEPNGSSLYRVASVRTTALNIGAITRGGKALDTQFMSWLAPGDVVAYGHGRLVSAKANVMYFSEPMQTGLCNAAHNYVMFKDPIDMIIAVGTANYGGWFVAAGKRTYWFDNADISKAQRSIAVPHGAVRGTCVLVDSDTLGIEGIGAMTTKSAYWMADNGAFYVGAQGGIVSAAPSKHFVGASGAENGASVVRSVDGTRQIVTTVRGGKQDSLSVSDTIAATEYRNGVQV